jgi:hypothetical protein
VDTHVGVRLDRAVGNGAFSAMFDNCRVENVITTTSDHLALAISLESFAAPVAWPPVQSGFKFEVAWLRSPEYKDVMQSTWAASKLGPPSLQGTWASLHYVAGSLKKWSQETFGSIRRKIKGLERQLLFLRVGPVCDASIKEAREIELKLCEMFEVEETMARQRSRVEWLKEGDRNTSFFHVRVSARWCANTIKALVREDGSRCDQLHEIKGMVENFYASLFTSEPCEATDVVLESIRVRVTYDMNAELCKEYTDEEIKIDRTLPNGSH